MVNLMFEEKKTLSTQLTSYAIKVLEAWVLYAFVNV